MHILTDLFLAAATSAAALFSTDSRCEPLNRPMIAIAQSYVGTPYVAHVLDRGEQEQLVICRNSVDCVTLVEYVLAEALCASSEQSHQTTTKETRNSSKTELFKEYVQRIRYKNGIIDGYASRLHYTSAWIENGVQQGFLRDVTAQHTASLLTLNLSFMSTHSHLYPRLKNNPQDQRALAQCEQELSGKQVHFLPEENLPDQGLPWIQEGDILCMVTNQKGLDIAHLGIACYLNNRLHLLHASSTLGKVVVSRTPLRQMLLRNKKWTGVRVLRAIRPFSSKFNH